MAEQTAKRRMVEIPMPSPGGYACCPSGDNEYDNAFCQAIKDGVPDGYRLIGKPENVKSLTRTVVQHFAIIEVEQVPFGPH